MPDQGMTQHTDCEPEYRETYGLIRQLREFLTYMKRGDYCWGIDDPSDKALNTVYALTVIHLVEGIIDSKYVERLQYFRNVLYDMVAKDKEYLLPYVLSLYLTYVSSSSERAKAKDEFKKLILKATIELKESERTPERLAYSLEYFFSVSVALNLLILQDSKDLANELEGKMKEHLKKLSSRFGELDERGRAKALFALSVLTSTQNELRSLYHKDANAVESLRHRIKEEDLLALLLKPYMYLGIECNRTILFRLADYFQLENQYQVQEGEIRHRLAQSLIYMGEPSKTGVEIQPVRNDLFQIRINISPDVLNILQRQAPSVNFIARIALWLALAGFRRTYTITESEWEEYRDFLRKERRDEYTYISKAGLLEVIKRASDGLVDKKLLRDFSLLLLSIIVSFSISNLVGLPTIEGTLAGSFIWLLVTEISQVLDIRKTYLGLIQTFLRRTSLRIETQKELMAVLES
jgi:hypothetical protein